MEYTYQQRIAMMRILLDIIHADGVIHSRETFFFNELKQVFELSDSDKEMVEEKNSLLALAQIKAFTKEQKNHFAELMAKMIVVDDDINPNEIEIYNIVRDFCLIEKGFDANVS